MYEPGVIPDRWITRAIRRHELLRLFLLLTEYLPG